MLKYKYDAFLLNLNILNTETGESVDLLMNNEELVRYKIVTGVDVDITPGEI